MRLRDVLPATFTLDDAQLGTTLSTVGEPRSISAGQEFEVSRVVQDPNSGNQIVDRFTAESPEHPIFRFQRQELGKSGKPVGELLIDGWDKDNVGRVTAQGTFVSSVPSAAGHEPPLVLVDAVFQPHDSNAQDVVSIPQGRHSLIDLGTG